MARKMIILKTADKNTVVIKFRYSISNTLRSIKSTTLNIIIAEKSIFICSHILSFTGKKILNRVLGNQE